MARKIELSNAAKSKVNKLFKDNEHYDFIINLLTEEKKILKDCPEKHIVEFYLSEILQSVPIEETKEWEANVKKTVRNKLASKFSTTKKHNDNIDIYFDEVKAEYIKHPITEQNDLEFLPENRDIFIKNNLKQVIECAKRYRNMGLTFEDLIQFGNEGLLKAFEKYDTERANLRISIIKDINASSQEQYTHDEAQKLIKRNFAYTKNLEQTLDTVPEEGFNTKDEFINWAKTNIKTAVFSSVAFQWIRASITTALGKFAHIVRVPKSTKTQEDGSPAHNLTIINLDSMNPHTSDNFHDNQTLGIAIDEFAKEDDEMTRIESENVFSDIIDRLLYKLTNTDKRILCKRFGIGYPYQLSIHDIAEIEGTSSVKVKESIERSLQFLNESIQGNDRELLYELLNL